jgi:hypothetical protein
MTYLQDHGDDVFLLSIRASGPVAGQGEARWNGMCAEP